MIRSFDIAKLAAQKMIDDNFIIFDTETTGIGADDEIVELGIIDSQGTVLYDGMFRPDKGMTIGATRVSGITDSMLVREPRFADEFLKIVRSMDGAGVIAFNESFDERMFYQTARKYGLDTQVLDKIFSNAYCAQQVYDQYIGYNTTKLELACETEGIQKVQTHRATDDCVMTLALLKCVADRERTPDYDRYCSVRSKATGKTVEEVSRPLNGTTKRKEPMYVEYAKMFHDGVSIAEMAEFKKVRVQTVEENLVEAYKNDYIKSIDFLIQPQFERAVREFIRQPDWDGRFTSVKNALPDECTWTTIKAVVTKVRKEKALGVEAAVAEPAQKQESKQKQESVQASFEDILSNAKSRAGEAPGKSIQESFILK